MSKADNVLLNKDTRLFYLSDDIDNDTIGKMCFHILSILKHDDEEESEKMMKRNLRKRILKENQSNYM